MILPFQLAIADPGDHIEKRLDKRGERIERRLDIRGDKIDLGLDRKSDRAEGQLDKRADRARENGKDCGVRSVTLGSCQKLVEPS